MVNKNLTKLLLSVFILLFLIQIISAVNSEVNVKTLPHHEVRLVLLDGSQVLQSLKSNADRYGDTKFIIESTKSNYNLNLAVYVKNLRGEKVLSESYAELTSADSPIYLELVPDGYVFLEKTEETANTESNQTEEVLEEEIIETPETEILDEETTETPENNSSDSMITGGFASKLKEIFSMTFVYILGGIILALIILFVILKIVKKNSLYKKPKEIIIRKLSELTKENNRDQSGEMTELEKRLESLQNEIKNLKNKESTKQDELEEKIDATKKRIQKEEAELIKLRELKNRR